MKNKRKHSVLQLLLFPSFALKMAINTELLIFVAISMEFLFAEA